MASVKGWAPAGNAGAVRLDTVDRSGLAAFKRSSRRQRRAPLLRYARRMRFLLVEDDRMIGESLRASLRLEGHA
ncbi:MAG: hypothetical protein AB9M60_04990, partial [Leptothrix sp. (in: b-proteobacteria)]